MLELSSSSAEDKNIDMDIENSNTDISVKPIIPTIRAKINIITPKVVGALDKCKISDRDGVHILVCQLKQKKKIRLKILNLRKDQLKYVNEF